MKFNSDGTCIELTIDEIWDLLVSGAEESTILREKIEILEHHHHEVTATSKPRNYVGLAAAIEAMEEHLPQADLQHEDEHGS